MGSWIDLSDKAESDKAESDSGAGEGAGPGEGAGAGGGPGAGAGAGAGGHITLIPFLHMAIDSSSPKAHRTRIARHHPA